MNLLLLICLLPLVRATCNCDSPFPCSDCYEVPDSYKESSYYDVGCRYCYDLSKNESINVDKRKGKDINSLLITLSQGTFGKETVASAPDVTKIRHMQVIYSEIEDNSLCWPESVRSLTVVCEKCPVLTEQTFSNCQKIKEFAIANADLADDALKHFHSVKNLTIVYRNEKSIKITKKLMDNFRNVEYLHLKTYNESQMEIDDGVICVPKNLKRLKLDSIVKDLHREKLTNCENVEHLELISTHSFYGPYMNLYDGVFKSFGNLKTLFIDQLRLPLTKSIFKGLKKLERLEIVSSRVHVDEDAFAEMPSLKYLKLHSIMSTVIDAEILKKNLPNLEYFSIHSGDWPIQDEIKDDLKKEFPFIVID